MRGVKELNALSPSAARAAILECCAAARWADAMVAARPFADDAAVHATADEKWRSLGPADWHEAFAAHPRIGERAGGPSMSEQAGVLSAGDFARAELAWVNLEYEARFGHIYLVCASGRSGSELLADARARMKNDPATELTVAAEELRKITQLRLTRLLETG